MGEYLEQQPSRDEIDALAGPAVVAFGTNWCGSCLGAERHIKPALAEHPELPVIWDEDGPGRPLGRSFRVKLWPTLIFLRDGQELARVVRPTNRATLDDALATITTPTADPPD
ncbi:thioredoxin family protein [Nostocoides veronense]|uniref:Thioredoxin family protein n=1 Tax=Nostocoides veronense TaxID=330836 RepID=A0ABP4XR45_9MICO